MNDNYAHPETLVSTDWVAQHLNDPHVRILESDEDVLLYEKRCPTRSAPHHPAMQRG